MTKVTQVWSRWNEAGFTRAGLISIAALIALAISIPIVLMNRASAVGGDFDLDFVAADPLSYVHTGGTEGNEAAPPALRCGSGTSCSSSTTDESLEPGDFACGDRIVFFTKVRVDAAAIGTQSIDIFYSFDAEPTGGGDVGYSAIIAVGISDRDAFIGDNFAATQSSEPGNINLEIDGAGTDEDAFLVSQQLDPPGSTFGVDAEELLATVRVTGLDASDELIVRIDVRFSCGPGGEEPNGTLHAQIDDAEVTGGGLLSTIRVGEETVPMSGFGQFEPPTGTPTNTATNTATRTATNTPTGTRTPDDERTPTATNTPTGTRTPDGERTPTDTPTNTATNTATNTPTRTQTPDDERTPPDTATRTATRTQTPDDERTPADTATRTATLTPAPSFTPAVTSDILPIIRQPTNTPPAPVLPEAGIGPAAPSRNDQLLIALAALGAGILGLGYWRLRLDRR